MKSIGYKIKKLREKCFPGQGGQTECAQALGVRRQELSRWENGGRNPSRRRLKQMAEVFGVTIEDILNPTDDSNFSPNNKNLLGSLVAPPDSQRMNVHKHVDGQKWWESDIQTWDVRGSGAANAQRGIVVDDTGYAEELIEPPEGLTLVRAKGESMSPLILDGQYAMIDKRREGYEVSGGIAVVVTVDNDGEYETRIKRCRRDGDKFVFSSIKKKNNPPFTHPASKCRIWPVIGVWFAGQGKPPKED